jgi:hypothetical protein
MTQRSGDKTPQSEFRFRHGHPSAAGVFQREGGAMWLKLTVLGVICLSLCRGEAQAQTCLHGRGELPAEEQRRMQAVTAVRIINTAEINSPGFVPLEDLGNAPNVQALRSDSGRGGDTARAMRFDREEILPGWRVHFVLGDRGYSVALSDTRDPCQFTLWSNEGGLIFEGRPITLRQSPRLATLAP